MAITEMGCKHCEYVCDTPLGSFCTLTNEAIESTDCHKDEQKKIEETQEWLVSQLF